MRAYVRRGAAVAAACLAVGLWLAGFCLPVAAGAWEAWPEASAGVSQGNTGTAPAAGWITGDGLTISGGEELLGGELQAAAQRARRMSPEAVDARERSRTEFEHLGRTAAEKVAGEAFPGLVNAPAGGPPKLPAGVTAKGFVTDNAETVDLRGGKHGVIESLEPIARETPHGHRVGLDLMLRKSAGGGGFAPTSALVGVRIPKRIGAGVSLAEDGVTLTPVDRHGAPLEGAEGVVDGASVFYGNTENAGAGVRDLDTLVKPETTGFSEETLLRSAGAPSTLYFKVGLPAGARLVRAAHGLNAVRVVDAGETLALISAPSAQDAEGVSVPLEMRVSGDMIVLEVQLGAGEYRYPVEVDPAAYAYDKTLGLPSTEGTNWQFGVSGSGKFEHYLGGGGALMGTVGAIEAGEYDEFEYESYGLSSIVYIEEESEASAEERSGAITSLEFWHKGASEAENKKELAGAGHSYAKSIERLCVPKEAKTCGEGTVGVPNLVRFAQTATKSAPEGYGFWSVLSKTEVGIRQESGPEVAFNKTEPIFTGFNDRENVLDPGSNDNSWLGTYAPSAFEVVAKDPGLGVSDFKVRDLTAGSTLNLNHAMLEEGHCAGVWCSKEFPWYVPYQSSMAEGENRIEACAENAARMQACTEATINVDNTKPRKIKLNGIAEKGAEISAAQHQLTVEATDGTKPTPSSGIRWIEASIDGKALKPESLSSCSPGECTATATFTIDGEALGAGEHDLVVTASDYASNELKEEYTFAVRNASPVGVGPGQVDPVTGQYRLSASDLDQADVGSVGRTYGSRSLAAGLEGPLGPQWALSAGAGETLKILANGNAELRSASGGRTTFGYNEGENKFKAPKGDENITLEPHEKEAGKGVTEYLLKNAAAGTTTKFTLPSGAGIWVPEATEGPAPNSKTGYAYRTMTQANEYPLPSGSAPDGITQGADGNLWFTDQSSGKVGKITLGGVVTEYSVPSGAWVGTITPGSEGDLWFVNSNKETMGRITQSGAVNEYSLYGGNVNGIAEGPDGSMWYTATDGVVGKVTKSGEVTHALLPGSPEARRIVSGPDQNMWFTDGSAIGRMNGFMRPGPAPEISVAGTPQGITTGPEGDLWFTTNLTSESRVGKVTPEGVVTEYPISTKENVGAGEITVGSEGDLWFVENAVSRIGKMTSGKSPGKVTEYSLPSGSKPESIVADPSGDLWYTDQGTNKIGVMSPAGVAVEPTEILGPEPAGVTCGKNPASGTQEELKTRLGELKAGCRALSFTYAEKTTATGEGSSEWGEFTGRLMKVSLTAYNPSSKAMQTTAVAEYAYDRRGELRAEWDPRVSPALKTTYGYDAEGRLTALTPPGQESWAFTYGGISGDPGTGRLLKVTRALASASLWKGEAVKNTEAPKITGTPYVGNRLAVSSGTWSGGSVVYDYQWEDCGENCKPIVGATNPNYTPVNADVGYTLVALVTAINGDGSEVVATAATATVSSTIVSEPLSEGSLNAVSCLQVKKSPTSEPEKDCVAGNAGGAVQLGQGISLPSGGIWNGMGEAVASPIGAADCVVGGAEPVCFIAGGSHGTSGGSLYYNKANHGEFPKTWHEVFGPTTGVDAVSCVSESFCVAGQAGSGDFAYSTNATNSSSWKAEGQGSAAMKAVDCLSSSFCAIADSKGNVHVAITTAQLESSSWKETDVDGTTALTGIACTSTTSCVAVDGSGNVINLTISTVNGEATAVKHNDDGTNSFTGISCNSPECAAVDNHGNIFVSTNNGATWTKRYTVTGAFTSVWCGPSELCAAGESNGEITEFNLSAAAPTEGEARSPQPGSTIEYHVPLLGSSAPYQMTSAEMAKWGQKKDIPEEATAIFPPDEPMGWPASDYKRASIDYLDGQARTVNTATPSGAISTTEYNKYNEVTRTLSAVNRATALKESCESETKCKSAEVAESLSSESIYNEEGTQLLETLGPEHKIKLASGTEEETRDHHKFSYNEGEPSGETHNLVTKEEGWSETTSHKKLFEHVSHKYYGGQGNTGWKLRKATMETSKKEGHETTSTSKYEPETGEPTQTDSSVVATEGPAQFAALARFGSSGSGNGQFNHPANAAIDASGDVWVTDQYNNRVEKFSPTGGFVEHYGSKGTGADQFERPWGIAVNSSTGNVYVSDLNNNRVVELNSSGAFVRTFGWGVGGESKKFQICTSSCYAGVAGSEPGQLNRPGDVAIDPSGNVWVADYENGRIEEYKENGTYVGSVGSKGAKAGQLSLPMGLAISAGHLYVTEAGNNRVDEFTLSGKFVETFGYGVSDGSSAFEVCETECGAGIAGTGKGQFHSPFGIAADPVSGDLFVADWENNRVQEFTASGLYMTEFGSLGSGEAQMHADSDVAIAPSGEAYVVDEGNERIDEWEPIPSQSIFSAQFGKGDFSHPLGEAVDAHGNVWVASKSGANVQEFSTSGTRLATYGKAGGGALEMSEPVGVAINQGTGNVYIGEAGNNRVQELNEKGEFVRTFGWGVSNGEGKLESCTSACKAGLSGSGAGELKEAGWVAVDSAGNVWVSDWGNNRVQEFTEKGEFIHAFGWGVSNGEEKLEVCTSPCKVGLSGPGAGELSGPTGIGVWNGHVYVADAGNNRIEVFSSEGVYVTTFGTKGTGNGQFSHPLGLTLTPAGNLFVADGANNRVQEFVAESGTYLTQFGTAGTGNGQFKEPGGVAVNATGDIDVVDVENGRIEEFQPPERPGNENARETRTIYYTQAANTEYPTCGKHPEWANLVCQTEPDAQPGDSGPTQLPVTATTYNMWDEPETIEEKVGSVTRTTKKTYDGAGRQIASEETSTSSPSENPAVPAVANEYSPETGALIKQTQTVEGKAESVTSVYNTLGQLTSYTDAAGATTKYTYDIDGRVEEISEPKGKQTYSYDATTGFLTKLVDSAAKTFTATYNVSGQMLTENYPNGMVAKYTYNTIGKATNLEYEKTTHCTEKCVLFSDADAYGAGGELMTQTSSLASEKYTYNELGQLTETQETPAGKGCITRTYSYNVAGERASSATREPGEKGECTSEGGLIEAHANDVLGRLIDPGVAYDRLGNMTKAPAADAGGMPIMSSFYADNQVATLEQNGKTITYSYDPTGRQLLAVAKQGASTTNTTSHYAGLGEALTWTCEESGGCKEEKETKWTRNIPGIDGGLDAIQTNGGTPVLQLHDLQGNIAATINDNESETKLETTYNSTEFGVSSENKAPKYGWLGASGAASELETGVITETGATYVPQIARTLQTEQTVPPGSEPECVGCDANYRTYESQWAKEAANQAATNMLEQQQGKEAAALNYVEDPWWMVSTAAEMWKIVGKVHGILEEDDHWETALEQVPGIGDFIGGSVPYVLEVFDLELERLEKTAEEMEKNHSPHAPGYFVQFDTFVAHVIGPETVYTAEYEEVRIPVSFDWKDEKCSWDGDFEGRIRFKCPHNVKRFGPGRLF